MPSLEELVLKKGTHTHEETGDIEQDGNGDDEEGSDVYLVGMLMFA